MSFEEDGGSLMMRVFVWCIEKLEKLLMCVSLVPLILLLHDACLRSCLVIIYLCCAMDVFDTTAAISS